MAIDIPAIEPELIYAGETVQWTRSFPDYPATDYTLKYYFNGPGAIDPISAAAYNTTDYLVTISAADSALYTYGIYSWVCYAEKGSGATIEKYRLGTGFITIKTLAGKSFAKTMLDAIEAILSSRATNKDLDLVGKTLGSSNITKKPELLMEYRAKYKSEYLAEQADENRKQGNATGNRILIKFKRPS